LWNRGRERVSLADEQHGDCPKNRMAGLQLPNKSLFHVSKINRRRVRGPKPGGINPLPLQPRFRNRRGQVSCDPAGRLSMCSKGPPPVIVLDIWRF